MEVQHFVDEDEMDYDIDGINKENMKEFCIFITDQKSENTTSKPCASFVRRRTRRGKRKMYFFHHKTSVKRKMAHKPATLAYFQLSIQWHLNTKGSTVNLHKDDFKLS